MRNNFLLAAFIGAMFCSEVRAQTTYGYSGGSQTYTVPAGVTSVRIKVWGGGGGAAANISGNEGAGGGSGYAQADVAVTPGQVLTIVVGRGGAGWTSTEGYAGATYPNGGTATNFGGGGGGRSEVTGTGVDIVAAGGGGGGYYFSGASGQGGYGGSTSGGAGGSSPNNAGGQGGTQSSGGAGGHGDCSTGSAGGLRSGGTANGANIPGGAGGDGVYGGGAGGGGLTNVGDSGGGGGGGSSYAGGTSTSNTVTTAGTGSTPGNSSDANRITSGYSTLGNYGAGVGATTATYRGGNGEVSITSLVVVPVITSSLTVAVNQGQAVSYQITASGNPTSYVASVLPSGLSVNTTNGLISGNITQANSQGSYIQATNSQGYGSATLQWNVTAAHIVDNASVSPSTITLSQSVTLTRSATANFGIAWTENVIWPPNGQSAINLGNMQLGSMGYTPVNGPGVYTYQFRVVDVYYNYVDQDISFTVNSASVTAPTSVTASQIGSTFVSLSWSGATAQLGISGYAVYRNGVFLANVGGTTFTDTTVSPYSTYTYTIVTIDTQSNASPASTGYSPTTDPDFEVFTPMP